MAAEVPFLNVVDLVGTIGGSVIAISLLPQVVKTWRTKSASDISYLYQAIYIVGCTMVNTYAILENLWPVYVPCLIEESLIITLTVMKVFYDRRGNNEATSESKETTKTLDETRELENSDLDDDDLSVEKGLKR